MHDPGLCFLPLARKWFRGIVWLQLALRCLRSNAFLIDQPQMIWGNGTLATGLDKKTKMIVQKLKRQINNFNNIFKECVCSSYLEIGIFIHFVLCCSPSHPRIDQKRNHTVCEMHHMRRMKSMWWPWMWLKGAIFSLNYLRKRNQWREWNQWSRRHLVSSRRSRERVHFHLFWNEGRGNGSRFKYCDFLLFCKKKNNVRHTQTQFYVHFKAYLLTFKVAACRRVNVCGDAMIVSTKISAPF